MDLLLRLLERRVIIFVAAILAAIWIGGRCGGSALGRADLLLHPPATAASPLAADIINTVSARESAKLKGLYRAVSAEIATAAVKGFQVAPLQRLADNALAFDTPAYRSWAVERLNKLRLAIPQNKETFRPAIAADFNADPNDSPRPKSKAVRK